MPNSSAILIGERKLRILAVLDRYIRLNSRQVTSLAGYSPSSLKLVERLLGELREEELVESRRMQAPLSTSGSTRYLFNLMRAGWKVLQGNGQALQERFRGQRSPEFRPSLERHLVPANDVLVSAIALSKTEPRARLIQAWPEWMLREARLATAMRPLFSPTICPDGFAWFRRNVAGRSITDLIWVEADCNTESKAKWYTKLSGITHFILGHHRQEVGIFLPTIATFAPNMLRRTTLKQWTESHLAKHGLATFGRLFCFTDRHPETTEPHTLWASPVWYQANEDSPTPLLNLSVPIIRTVRLPKAQQA